MGNPGSATDIIFSYTRIIKIMVQFQISSEAIDNVRTVAALNKEDRFETKFNDHFDEAYKYNTYLSRIKHKK